MAFYNILYYNPCVLLRIGSTQTVRISYSRTMDFKILIKNYLKKVVDTCMNSRLYEPPIAQLLIQTKISKPEDHHVTLCCHLVAQVLPPGGHLKTPLPAQRKPTSRIIQLGPMVFLLWWLAEILQRFWISLLFRFDTIPHFLTGFHLTCSSNSMDLH